MRIPKRVTAKQLEANRRNSLKSTGPKTQSGKVHSSRNSWKHGILSAQVPVLDGRGREDAQRFGALLAALQEDLEPCGTLEDLLVQQIAIAYWRLARAHRCEAAEIAKNSESVEDRFDEHQRQSVAEGDPDLMRKSSRGIEMLSQTLRRAEMELKFLGYLTDITVSRLAACYGSEVGEFLEVFQTNDQRRRNGVHSRRTHGGNPSSRVFQAIDQRRRNGADSRRNHGGNSGS